MIQTTNFKTIVFTVASFLLLSFQSAFAENKESVQKDVKPLSVQEETQNELGLIRAANKLEEASKLLEEEKIKEAEKILLESKQWLTDSSQLHFELFQILNKNIQTSSEAKIEKAHALDFAKVRDKAYFLLAKVYILQNKLREAVSLLVEIIKSQPDSKLAQDSYKTLQEIKFSDKIE